MKFSFLAALLVLTLAGCASGDKSKDKSSEASKETKAEMTKEGKMDNNKRSKNSSQSSKMTSAGKVECSMKNDKRTVEVRKSDKGCELAYSKFGNEEVVATSVSGTSHCQKISERIVGNLENAGFACSK